MFYVSLRDMSRFRKDIIEFLEGKGFLCRSEVLFSEDAYPQIIRTCNPERWIIPVEITASGIEEARRKASREREFIAKVTQHIGHTPIIITEDRWRRCPDMMQERLLAHMQQHIQIYARNCEVRRIEKPAASDFLAHAHSYGDAACRYRYGLFLKRHTGHLADKEGKIPADTMVAVATFSNARKWTKGEKSIRSYEWTRYASLPGLRVSGGMGKMLKAFIEDVKPDDIMTYADLEWSEGAAYESLGFTLEDSKSPVCFSIDTHTWERTALPQSASENEVPAPQTTAQRFHMNFGSAKYRMKLTDYE